MPVHTSRSVSVKPNPPVRQDLAATAGNQAQRSLRKAKAGLTVNHLPADTLLRMAKGPAAGKYDQILPVLAHALAAEATLLIEFEKKDDLTVTERHAHGSHVAYVSVGPEFEGSV